MNLQTSVSASIRKAVFPVAGIGTRFLPATKANPKEMMPVVDKPLIQYAVEEAIQAGITELIFVTSSSKRAIEDHFDTHFELETRLKEQKKEHLLNIVRSILPDGISCVYIRQPEALGLGHAILCAKAIVGNDPFAVLLADDLIMTDVHQGSCLAQMVLRFETCKSSIVAVEPIDLKDSGQYGVIGVPSSFSCFGEIEQIVEKPSREKAPSQLGVVGRYILTPEIFHQLENIKPGANSELQLTDAIDRMIRKEAVYALEFLGKRYDCGSKLGYLQAIVAYGLQHPEVEVAFKQYLHSIVSNIEDAI